MTRTEAASSALRLQWCSYALAKDAVGRWHYSRRIPNATSHKIGVWEGERFMGAVTFGPGAASEIGTQFGLVSGESVCELTRVALRPLGERATPTSRIVSVALRLLRRQWPALRLVVSYADPLRGHHGGIYKAMGWTYLGQADGGGDWLRLHGKPVHPRSVYTVYRTRALDWLRIHVDPAASRVQMPAKHKYVYPLDDAMRALVAPVAQPYPCAGSIGADAPSDQLGEGGSRPTSALQLDLGDAA